MCGRKFRVFAISIAATAVLGLVMLPALMAAGATQARADVGERWPFSRFQNSPERGGSRDHSLGREREARTPAGYPTLSAANIQPTVAAIERYEAIAAEGGWKPIPMTELRRGMHGEAVRLLRERLERTGDLARNGRNTGRFGYYVERAVKRFQSRHGLAPTGRVDKSTLLALNVSAEERLRQLRTNLSRIRPRANSAPDKYVLVNIPAAEVEAVEQDEVVSRHAAVVGKPDRQSPVLRSAIHEINFNPYWTIPASIVRKDLVPTARRYARNDKDILSSYRIDAFDGEGRKLNPERINWNSEAVYGYRYRQRPWEDNSLGFVKINFPNQHAVYLHDTPSQSLFGRNFRAESSGCVRVRNVERLVAWLLESNPDWDINRVMRMEQTGERKDVSLNERVSVYFAYITAWATPDGTVRFRRDLYARDGVGPTASAY